MLINGSIGEWNDNNNKRITNEIAALDAEYDEIFFLLNSPGGQVSEGIAIYHAIKGAKAKTTGVVVGLAASIAFILLQAFDKRVMKKATRGMSHKFSGGGYGSAKQLRDKAKMMEDWESEVIDEIVDRSGQSKETVQAWFTEGEDKWFSPKDMLKFGLIDEIDNSKTEKAPANIATDAEALYKHYNTAVVNELGLDTPRPDNGGNGKTQNSNSNKNEMKKEHLAIIGLSEGASEEAIANKLQALVKSEEVANSAQAMLKANAENQVSAMIEAGKLDKEQKDFAVNLLVEKPDEAGKFLNSMAKVDGGEGGDALRPDQLIKAQAGKGSGKSKEKEERKEWDLDMWMKEDPQGLDKLSDEEYDEIANRSNAQSVK